MKEHFREYNDICTRIKELETKVSELRADLYSVSGVPFDRIPSESHNTDITLLKLSEIDDYMSEITELKLKKMELYNKHIKEISALDDDKQRQVLRCWYLLKMNVSSIEKLTGYDRSHIYRIKKEAEEAFLESCDKMRQNTTVCDK